MFCGSCGKQVPEGSGFCPACGASAGGGAPRPAAAAGAAGGPSAAAAQRAKLEAQFKAGSQDAIAAVKVLLADPVGGLAKSFAMFDSGRAQIVGGMFAVAFAILATIGGALMGGMIMGMVGGMMGGGMGMPGMASPSLPFSAYLKIFVIDLIQAAGLVIGCMVTRMIFKGAGTLASDLYIAGSCLLPAGVGLLAGALLGNLVWWLFLLPVLFGGCYCILMLYAGGMNIGKISEGKAALGVPIALSIMFAAWYLGIRIMM